MDFAFDEAGAGPWSSHSPVISHYYRMEHLQKNDKHGLFTRHHHRLISAVSPLIFKK